MLTTKRVRVYEQVLSNLLNGNLSDYKEQLNKFSKYELIEFIAMCKDYGEDIRDLKIYKYLEEEYSYMPEDEDDIDIAEEYICMPEDEDGIEDE